MVGCPIFFYGLEEKTVTRGGEGAVVDVRTLEAGDYILPGTLLVAPWFGEPVGLEEYHSAMELLMMPAPVEVH